MNYEELIGIITPLLGHELDDEQESVIQHIDGPLWVVAGPGSGKTEVLVLRVLKMIFVNDIDPGSIILTTFTEKAANNLFQRILRYSNEIFRLFPDLQNSIDIHLLRVGTLHGLCNDIMQEYKYPGYENYRLLDELEQYLFIYEHVAIANSQDDENLPLWHEYSYLVDGYDPISNSMGWNNRERLPNKWKRTNAAIRLFDRIVDDEIDVNRLTGSDSSLLLQEAYGDYVNTLETHNRCDFSHLQSKFLDFLVTPLGNRFINGDGSERHQGISYVLVDEYQDTNPIQEHIYFELVRQSHNLCVVGDDDQALYRFRGGTVECMVNFGSACNRYLGVEASSVRTVFLNKNYRSHENIVEFFDQYITSFATMHQPGARVSDKPTLDPESDIAGNYPAVARLSGRTIPITAEIFGDLVRELIDHEIISGPEQCALLMRSVRETARNAGPFAESLRNHDITPYNPRSRTFLQQAEVQGILGALVYIVDPDGSALAAVVVPSIRNMVEEWRAVYDDIAGQNPGLNNYVSESTATIRRMPQNSWVNVSILEVFYRILAQPPFHEWSEDHERTYRIGKLSRVLETYSAVPLPGRPGSNRGSLRIGSTQEGQISWVWRMNFYYSFVGLLVAEGLNDPEEGGIICPPDQLPIMTVHQAKGLEFPFVFVYGLNRQPQPGPAVRLENALAQYRTNLPAIDPPPDQKAIQDLIRFYYVAYSRAQYALVLLVPQAHFRSNGLGFPNQSYNQLRTTTREV